MNQSDNADYPGEDMDKPNRQAIEREEAHEAAKYDEPVAPECTCHDEDTATIMGSILGKPIVEYEGPYCDECSEDILEGEAEFAVNEGQQRICRTCYDPHDVLERIMALLQLDIHLHPGTIRAVAYTKLLDRLTEFSITGVLK